MHRGTPQHLFTAFLAVLLACPLLLAGAGQAQAAPKYQTKTSSYDQTIRVYSSPLKRCINVSLTGKVRFQYRTVKGTGASRIVEYANPRLIDPRMRIGIGTKCAAGAKRALLYKLKIGQNWHGQQCSWNPSIQAGFGPQWGVGVGATPTCGDANYARRVSNFGKGGVFNQYTSLNPVIWKHRKNATARTGTCMNAFVEGVMYTNSRTSDDFKIAGYKVCMRVA